MYAFADQVEIVRDYLIRTYHPERIVLFGSVAKGRARDDSDLDICVVMPVMDKRALSMQMQTDLVNLVDRDVEIILLSPSQWEQFRHDPATFTYQIEQTGIVLHS